MDKKETVTKALIKRLLLFITFEFLMSPLWKEDKSLEVTVAIAQGGGIRVAFVTAAAQMSCLMWHSEDV